MEFDPTELRTHFRFTDYLYYSAAGLVPVLTGAVAIYPQSVLGLICYGAVALAGAVAVLFFFCAHCPHYGRQERTLRCMFFWGLPKVFAPRPGPLGAGNKLAALAAMLVVFAFPLAWLAEDPGLMAVYLLSSAVFAATLRRYECVRCVYRDCPANRADAGDEEAADDLAMRPEQD